MSDYIRNLSDTHQNYVSIGVPYFDTYLTDNDIDYFVKRIILLLLMDKTYFE